MSRSLITAAAIAAAAAAAVGAAQLTSQDVQRCLPRAVVQAWS